MKKNWVRFLGMLLALLMALGCTAAFAEGDDFSGTVTISLYSAKGVQEAWEAVGAAYTAKHPNVKVVVDLKPQDGYADWVKAAFQGYDSALPEADIVYGNLAGSDRVDKVVNFYEYAFDDSPYSDGTWADQIAFDLQNIDAVTGDFSLQSAGFLIENGELGRPVHGFTVADNFFELLKKITCVAGDLKFTIPSGFTVFGGSSVAVTDVSIAGK